MIACWTFLFRWKKLYFPFFVLYRSIQYHLFWLQRSRKKDFPILYRFDCVKYLEKQIARKMKSRAFFHFVKRCKWHESPQNTRFYAVRNSMGFLMLFSVWIIFIIFQERKFQQEQKSPHRSSFWKQSEMIAHFIVKSIANASNKVLFIAHNYPASGTR